MGPQPLLDLERRQEPGPGRARLAVDAGVSSARCSPIRVTPSGRGPWKGGPVLPEHLSLKCQGLSKSQCRRQPSKAGFELFLNETEAQSARQAVQGHMAAAFTFRVSLLWLLSHFPATSVAHAKLLSHSSALSGGLRGERCSCLPRFPRPPLPHLQSWQSPTVLPQSRPPLTTAPSDHSLGKSARCPLRF